MSDERPREYRAGADGYPPDEEPDDFEVLLCADDGPEPTVARSERNTELLAALTAAARDSGVVPIFLQLPAAPRAAAGAPPVDEALCLRLEVRTRPGFPLGRVDFLNAALRLAGAYRLGMHVGETSGTRLRYQQVLARPGSAPDPDARPDARRRVEPAPRARHRVIDLTAPVPIPPRAPLDGSLMVTVVGPADGGLAADLARIAVFFDDHRVGCHAASASLLAGTIVITLVLAVLPGAPVGTGAFTEILRSGLGSDPVWPARFRPTLLDPVTTR